MNALWACVIAGGLGCAAGRAEGPPVEREHRFEPEELSWWAFQPLADVEVPEVSGEGGRLRGAVDRFVVSRLLEAGLEQAPEAEPEALVRRLYFNLHGLPPTTDQIEAFLKDDRADAYERLVDDLLASPRYGMRWGQHWLDLVRYAESDGYREDKFRPDAWPYRDYVIRSPNEDKPYDQFVREQLAGDELAPGDPEVLVATGFLRHGIYEWNQADAEGQREIIVKELTGLTGELFLGMSVGCAECHDHKFDPILQEDYYRLKAFFEPVQWRDDLSLATALEQAAYQRELAAWEAEAGEALRAWEDAKAAAVRKGQEKALAYFPAEVKAMYAKAEEARSPYEQQVVYLVERRLATEAERAVKKLQEKSEAWKAYQPFEKQKPRPLQRAFVATDVGREAPPTLMKDRNGEVEVLPGFLTILAPGEVTARPQEASTGRRTALAEWITDPANPLTARVMVNRVWQYHFGRGLSANTSDFGSLGEEPSHPELLDWLTSRFIENDWSLKWLHREILNSATYRQSSEVGSTAKTNEVDPANRWLWRARPQRMDAAQLRDTLLMLSGELSAKEGGPSEPGSGAAPTVFTKKLRNTPDELLTRFDAPPGFQSVAKRNATNTALQSLLLVNAEWPMARARKMAGRLLKKHPGFSPADLASAAMAEVYGRESSAAERAAAGGFLQYQEDLVAEERRERERREGATPLVDGRNLFPGLVGEGEQVANFQPGTDHERVVCRTSKPEPNEFFVEAIVNLDTLYADASVRTIASRWAGSAEELGWALGVTSTKSRFAPNRLIMQLNGYDFQRSQMQVVVDSELLVPLDTPYYVAALMSSEGMPGGESGGRITFFVKDLTDPASPLQTTVVAHELEDGYTESDRELVIGGRALEKRHLWDGAIHRVVIGEGAVLPDERLWEREEAGGLFSFEGSHLEAGDGCRWDGEGERAGAGSPRKEALADLFHTLINSNEFLYLP